MTSLAAVGSDDSGRSRQQQWFSTVIALRALLQRGGSSTKRGKFRF